MLLRKLAEANAKMQAVQNELDAAKQRLNEYEEKAKKAEDASRMKSLFLANMSHEIRTPLNAIEGFSRVMAETDSAEDRMKYMEIVESNNGRVLALINEILDLSRVEAGEISINKSMTDLSELCKNIQLIFKFRCSEGVHLSWSNPTMNVTLNTDPNRLTQIFSNLISNALKFSVSQAAFTLQKHRDRIKLIQTNDTTLPDGSYDQIFDRFTMLENAAGTDGSGIGLAHVKNIVKSCNGRLSAAVRNGTMTITLDL